MRDAPAPGGGTAPADADAAEPALDELDPVAMFRAKAQIKAGLFPASADASPREPVVGRYTLLRRIGRGGFGVVFRARDPKLDRHVAIKLIPLGSRTVDDDGTALDEARTMARLRDPALVAIYDVGTCDGAALLGPSARHCVFIVMELLGGQSLDQWLSSERPSVAQRIAVHAQAGEGIASAHEQGVVHRDLKPRNIHIEGSRVIVLDFGLATVVDDPAKRDAGDATSGTPSYMAPEQHDGGAVGAAADQFALAVCLFECLYGRLPFEGPDAAARVQAKRAGPPAIPTLPPVPARVRRALRRALSASPNDRFASMRDLVRALRVRRRWWVGLLSISSAAIVVSAWAGFAGWFTPPDQCQRHAAAAEQLWNPQVRARVKAAFERHQLDYGDATLAEVDRVLDTQMAAWTEARLGACRDRESDGGSGPASAREYCLDRYRERAAAVVTVLEQADATVVANVPRLLDELRRLQACDREGTLPPRPGWLIDDAKTGLAVDSLIVRSEAHAAAGNWPAARTLAREALEQASALAAPGLQAEAAWALCRAHGNMDGRALALQLCEQALVASERAARPDLPVEIHLHMASVSSASRPDDIQHHLELAEARRGALGTDVLLDAQIERVRARLAAVRGDSEGAVASLRTVRSTYEAELGPDAYGTLSVTNQLALELSALGRYDEARVELRHAEQSMRRTQGPGHPGLAAIYNNLGYNCELSGDLDCARESLEQALRIKEVTLGHHAPGLLTTLSNLSSVHERMGDQREALAVVRRAIAIVQGLPDELQLLDELRAKEITLAHDPPDHQSCAALAEILARRSSNAPASYVAAVGDRTALCWAEVGEPQRAYDALQTVLAGGDAQGLLVFDRVRLFNKLARLAHALDRRDEARTWLDRIVSDPQSPPENRSLALGVLAALVDVDDEMGALWLDRALGSEAGDPKVQRALEERVRAWLQPDAAPTPTSTGNATPARRRGRSSG